MPHFGKRAVYVKTIRGRVLGDSAVFVYRGNSRSCSAPYLGRIRVGGERQPLMLYLNFL